MRRWFLNFLAAVWKKKINSKILLALKRQKTQTNSKDCSERQKVFCSGFFLRRFAGRIFIISTKFQRSKQKLYFNFLNKKAAKYYENHQCSYKKYWLDLQNLLPPKKSSCDSIPLKWKEQRPPVLEPSSTLFAFGALVQYWGSLRRRKRTHIEELYQTKMKFCT